MLAIRLPPEIEARLEALAKKTGRTKTYYVREAILEHLGDPLRSLLQPLAVGVLPDLTQELLDQLLHSRPSAAPGPHSKRLFSVSTRATRQSRPGGRTGSSKR